MTELIKEVTPPKKPAFANPYEAANPMIRPLPKKQPVRKTRAATKANAKEEQKKEQELTPQAIIEATVPKVRVMLVQFCAKADSGCREASVLGHRRNSSARNLLKRMCHRAGPLLPGAALV